MTRDNEHNPDPNANAARIAKQATSAETVAFADFEAAWLEWASGIQAVDEHALTLLKAAFEAGWQAGRRS
jgi:hypothetical protein